MRLLGVALLLWGGWLGPRPVHAASDSIALRVTPYTSDSLSPPEAITDLSAATNPALEGEAVLSWTAPDGNSPATGMTVAGYLVRMATFSIDSLAGDTTAWWTLAATAPVPSPQAPGSLELLSLSGLEPGNTYYFAVRSTDTNSNLSIIDTRAEPGGPPQAYALIPDIKPPAPANLSASPGLSAVDLSWDAVAAADLDYYRLHVDSTPPYNFADEYLITVDSTASSYSHTGLTPGTSYHYFLTAVDKGAPSYDGYALESDPSTSTSTVTLSTGTLPMEPLGLSVAATATDVSLSWSPTTRFITGGPFADPAAPTPDELVGYSVFRASGPCTAEFVHVSSLPYTATSLVNATGGLNYYYRVYSYNAFGVSTSRQTVSSLGEYRFAEEGCAGAMILDSAGAAALDGDSNGRGSDVWIRLSKRPQDIGETTFQSLEWRAYLDGVQELPSFVLPKPARFALRFETAGGVVVPSGASPQAQPSAVAAKDLGVYWYNGAEYKKMYGVVDAAAQTVTVESPNLGIYQVRAQARANGAVFDHSNVSNRVITPNGDGLNDALIFSYDPGPRNAAVRGRIYDLRGAVVADMAPGAVPNTLSWDGRMNGRVVAGGVYVYKIEGDGKSYTGTVVVAR